MRFLFAILSLSVLVSAFQVSHEILSQAEVHSPNFAAILKRARDAPEDFIKDVRLSGMAAMAPEFPAATARREEPRAGSLPVVVTHGMGDSCFNSGMKQITSNAGAHLGQYAVCVPGGPNEIEDTLSGFLVTMDKNVDIFANKVRADPQLVNGFDAFGLSQGISVLRGYIERYNDPPVRNYISIHGTVRGVAGFPNCNPSGFLPGICDTIAELCGDLAYEQWVQNSLFQANYFRDPTRTNTTQYMENSQIAGWNNENAASVNSTYVDNFNKVKSFNMIKAMKDSMVYPNEGEWWGEFVQGQFKEVNKMKDTAMYQNNLFGLQTADMAGKINFNSTTGNHLDFTMEELYGWLDAYFV
jgi:palmitoyl-protein thioesterase